MQCTRSEGNDRTEMSELTLGLGRKRRIDIWSHFTYDNKDNKTACKQCGAKIAGKNTTNLKRHLQTTHPEIQAKVSIHAKVILSDKPPCLEANRS